MGKICLLKHFCLALLLACSNCAWAYNFEVDGIYYEIVDENTVYVVNGYDSYYGDIVIPSTVTLDSVTYDVQGVMHGAFDYSGITSLTFPSTLYVYYPITGCYALESIVVQGDDGYYDSRNNCNAIIETSTNRLVLGCKNTVIPSTVEVIGYAAFAGCGFSSFTIPANVTRIEDEAFKECYALTDLYIEDGDKPLAVGYGTSGYDQKISIFYDSPLTKVYFGRDIEMIDPYLLNNISGVFAEKQTLSSVTIGERVTEIQDNTFNSCRGLNSIDIPGSVVRIGHSAFEGCGLTGELVIPGSVKEIGDNAFLYCSGLTGELVIPEGVVSIGMQAFSGNEMLTGVKLPKSLKVLGERAFAYCRGLDNVVIPNGITCIGYDMFNECIALKNVVIPESVVEIRGGAFANCTALEEITIPNGVTILENAFWGCTALKKVSLPGSLVTIGDYAFRYCHSLESITIPNSVMQIGESAFEECALLKSVVIPNSVTRIGRYAFNGCASLSQISFPEGLEYVGGGAFHNTAWYKSWGVELVYIGNLLYKCKIGDDASGFIEIREGTTAICEGAFISCNVKNIKIPNSVEYIGIHAFDSSKWYKSWYESQPDGPIYIGKVLFDYKGDVPNDFNLVVKDGTTGITTLPYKIKNITIPPSVKYITSSMLYDMSNVYISDLSAWCNIVFDRHSYGLYKSNFYLNGELLTDLVIPEGVERINNYAFEHIGNLKSIRIPNSVTSIGDYVYYDEASDLRTIVIGSGVKRIGSMAFYYGADFVVNYSDLPIKKGDSSYGYVAYDAKAVISKDDDVVGDYCFRTINGEPTMIAYIGNGRKAELPADYKGGDYSIAEYAFYKCDELEEVVISDRVTSFGEYAFAGCKELQKVTIGNGVVNIGDYAFDGCRKLSTLVIGEKVKEIGDNSFYGCAALKTVYNNSSLNIVKGGYGYGWVAYYATAVVNKGDDVRGDFVFRVSDGEVSLVAYLGDASVVSLPDNYDGNSYAIGDDLFYKFNMTNLTIPDCVTAIGDEAFYKCNKLESINIPSSVKSVGSMAFGQCDALKAVNITDLSAWCDINFKGYLSNPLNQARNLYLNGELVTELVVPEDVAKIKDYSFTWCANLKSVTIGDNVAKIGFDAFKRCYNLKKITLGQYVERISGEAFYGCDALEYIYLTGVIPAKVAASAFTSEHYEKVILHVPESAIEAYRTADVWKEFKNIQAYETAGIDDCEMNSVACEYVGGGVRFVGVHNEPLSVYNTDGALVKNFITYSGETIVLEKGIYIISVGDANIKIVLK